jgi:hypothetical protein
MTNSYDRVFYIRRSLPIRPLLLLVGLATRSRSLVAIERDRLRVRFGVLFDSSFALTDVESVSASKWPWFGGLGWRSDLSGMIALVGSYGGIVEVRFKTRTRHRFLVPFWKLRCNRLFLSLEEPEECIEALRAAVGRASLHSGGEPGA